jgi:phage-related protein
MPQQTGTQTLQFLLSQWDTEKQIQARVRSRKTIVDPEYTFGFIKSQITMFCPDPRYYDNFSSVLTLSQPAVLNGRTYNRTYDLSFGGGSSVTSVVLNNTGRIYTSPIITIVGPIANPVIGTYESNSAITVNTTLGATDVLVVDLNQKVVTLNGTSVRNLVAPGSKWFVASPGTNTFYFTGTAGSTTSATSATITYSSAYV